MHAACLGNFPFQFLSGFLTFLLWNGRSSPCGFLGDIDTLSCSFVESRLGIQKMHVFRGKGAAWHTRESVGSFIFADPPRVPDSRLPLTAYALCYYLPIQTPILHEIFLIKPVFELSYYLSLLRTYKCHIWMSL